MATWKTDASTEAAGSFWPRWIHLDLPQTNIYTLGYPARVFSTWLSGEQSIYERAKGSLEYLASYGFGSRPTVLICHSLGGLLAKQMIRVGLESSELAWKAIAERIVAVFFISTPHTGSSIASALDIVLPRLRSSFVDLLRRGNPQLDELNSFYRNKSQVLRIVSSVYYEKLPTKGALIVVDKASADPGIQNVEPIPIDADHISISKPRDRSSPLYRSITRRIQLLLNSEPKGDFESVARTTYTAPRKTDEDVPNDILNVSMQRWLSEKLLNNLGTRTRSSHVLESMRSPPPSTLAGVWRGESTQQFGLDGNPVSYPVRCEFRIENSELHGTFSFSLTQDGKLLADETVPMQGSVFQGRYLCLQYADTVTGKLQFGALLLDFDQTSETLTGVDLGIGNLTRRIMSANLSLKRASH